MIEYSTIHVNPTENQKINIQTYLNDQINQEIELTPEAAGFITQSMQTLLDYRTDPNGPSFAVSHDIKVELLDYDDIRIELQKETGTAELEIDSSNIDFVIKRISTILSEGSVQK